MRALFLALVPAGVALAVLAYEVEVDSLNTGDARAVAPVAAGLSFLVCGLIAWSRRPANRLGALMVATGFALLLRQLRYSHDALAFTVFFALGDLGFALVAHSVLAYPSGRIRSQAERWLVRVAYATALAFPLAILLLHDKHDSLRQFDSLLRKSDFLVVREAHAVEVLQNSYAIVFFGVLACGVRARVHLRRQACGRRSLLAPGGCAGGAPPCSARRSAPDACRSFEPR
jgi:hypothetical protein